jgi:hypothetical protein
LLSCILLRELWYGRLLLRLLRLLLAISSELGLQRSYKACRLSGEELLLLAILRLLLLLAVLGLLLLLLAILWLLLLAELLLPSERGLAWPTRVCAAEKGVGA